MKYIITIVTFLFSNNVLANQNLQNGIILGPLSSLLSFSEGLTSDVGFAIILMTILLRLMLTPLQYLSQKSMKKMKEIQPQLELIKGKFSKKPLKIREETMKLFKQSSVNPLSGIIPILLQTPLFFAIFELLRESPITISPGFWGWFSDLSVADPLYILPIIAGAVQLISMLSNKNEGAQGNMFGGKMKFAMAAGFTGIMFNMPAAVLVYSITSSATSIFEKCIINKMLG